MKTYDIIVDIVRKLWTEEKSILESFFRAKKAENRHKSGLTKQALRMAARNCEPGLRRLINHLKTKERAENEKILKESLTIDFSYSATKGFTKQLKACTIVMESVKRIIK